MLRLLATLALATAGLSLTAGCGGGDEGSGGASSTSSSSAATTTGASSSSTGGGDVTSFYYPPLASCAYDCANLKSCPELTKPYVCPSLGNWADVPHDPGCPAFDGTYPAVVKGKCTASAPKGSGAAETGPDPNDATAFVLPDARRMHPAGSLWVFTDVPGGLTSMVIDAPGTPYALAVETGYGDHAVRSIDLTKLAAGDDPVASVVTFTAPETLNSGLALRAPDRLFVASHDGAVHALSFNPATGALARDDAHALTLPTDTAGGSYASGLAISPDASKLIATFSDGPSLLVYSIVDDATYGTLLGTLNLGAEYAFTTAFDPNDPTGNTVYVSLWGSSKVLAVDVSDPVHPAIAATYATQKDPEGIAFLDARYLVVADGLGDALTLVDRVTKEVTSVPVDFGSKTLHGGEPTVITFDPAASRLYVTDAGDNALVGFDVDLSGTTPTLTRVGRLGTAWWPSGVVVRSTGDVVVTTLRGQGGGPIPMPWSFDNDIGLRMKGSVQLIAQPNDGDLSEGDEQVATDDDPEAVTGVPTVSCPSGAHDFPLPETNQGGSPKINHVFFILRENKNFDSLLGDFPDVDGEPAYTMKATTADMNEIWHNFRDAARAFALSDNYYTDAVFSTQGHVLATYGRGNDFDERTWIESMDRDGSPYSVPGGGVFDVGQPVEGSLFDWLYSNKVPFNILGEVVGQPTLPPGSTSGLDFHYPGVFQDITLADLQKACYASGRVRVGCNLGQFVYQTLPNDHTIGVSSSNPTPETMCAVNDEATGMMLDAISHSPYWKSSLVIITEDDPSQGGEHVDGHRTPLVLVSPWIKRGYVSKTHMDAASLHKIFAHVFGIPYPNRLVERAVLPFDMFTSTPSYEPFEFTHRTWPLACGQTSGNARTSAPASSAEEELTSLWDFSHEDQQPGLGAQVWRAMRGTPLDKLTPEMRAVVARAHATTARDDD